MITVIGNWKMAPEKHQEALTLFKKTLLLSKAYKKITFISCVPFIHLPFLARYKQKSILLGAQDTAASAEVAQTGLIGTSMLASYGAKYCIVGHSEARQRGDADEHIAEKVQSLFQKKITPIVCVGEKERDAHGWYLSAVKDQVEKIVSTLSPQQVQRLIIAYEPVWAIGKNAVRVATPLECREMIIFIRRIIADAVGEKEAQKVHIVYGALS